MDYILWLDADDILKEEDLEKLLELKQNLDPGVDSVTMKYHLAFDEHGNVISSLRRNRLVKRSNDFRWIGAVHEYLEVAGRIIDSDIAVTHCGDERDSDRNLNIYMKRQAKGEVFTPRDTYYFANELKDHRFFELAAVYYRKFLDEGKGWVEDNIAACGKLADCYLELGDNANALAFTLKSFEYRAPRPEFCCRMGYHFLQAGDYAAAVYWYRQALENPAPANTWGMQNLSCSTWLPTSSSASVTIGSACTRSPIIIMKPQGNISPIIPPCFKTKPTWNKSWASSPSKIQKKRPTHNATALTVGRMRTNRLSGAWPQPEGGFFCLRLPRKYILRIKKGLPRSPAASGDNPCCCCLRHAG